MTIQNNPVRLIARTPQGGVYVSLDALKQAVYTFIKNQIATQKLPLGLERVEFVCFSHPVNFQVNVFVKAKTDDTFSCMQAATPIQREGINYLGQEFNLEPLTFNVVCTPRKRSA